MFACAIAMRNSRTTGSKGHTGERGDGVRDVQETVGEVEASVKVSDIKCLSSDRIKAEPALSPKAGPAADCALSVIPCHPIGRVSRWRQISVKLGGAGSGEKNAEECGSIAMDFVCCDFGLCRRLNGGVDEPRVAGPAAAGFV